MGVSDTDASVVRRRLRVSLLLLIPLGIVGQWWLFRPAEDSRKSLSARVERAIPHAVRFLEHQQLPSGAFPGVVCRERSLAHCTHDITPFVSTFVLHALSFLPPEQTQRLREPAVTFLLAAQHSPGLWSYYAKQSSRHTWSPPDLDDTACARAALQRMGHPIGEQRETIENLRAPDGAFWTWVGLSPEANEVDCAVTANVVFALALEGAPHPETIAYLNQIMANHQREDCSRYYLEPEALFYFMSRAYRDGRLSTLEPAVSLASEQVRTRQQPDGGFGDAPTTAFAALTWLNAGHTGQALERAVDWLVKRQRSDGGWGTRAIYARVAVGGWVSWSFHGSESMTAALALEALVKMRDQSIQ